MATSKEIIDFVNLHSKDVIKSVRGTGLFASVKMAQMIIESSGDDANGVFHIGTGLAVRMANNYFGIKAGNNWKGRVVALSTPKDSTAVSYFRVYGSVLESLQDHTRFLIENPRYKINGVFDAKTPQQQAFALQRAGYAESQNYSNAIKAMIAAYGLEELDRAEMIRYRNFLLIGCGIVAVSGLFYYQDEIKEKINRLLNPKKLRYA